jgi:tetratricopeptide (TPR) repeat protein
MSRIGRSAFAALGFALSAAVLVPAAAMAQDAAATKSSAEACSVEYNGGTVGTAYFQLTSSMGAARDKKLAGLRNAVKNAAKDIEKGQNLPARNFIMGKAFVTMLTDSLVTASTTRGQLGLETNPTAPVDLIVTIDSLFDAVVAASPDCAPETSDWRQQKPWIDLLQGAIVAMQLQQFDSAAMLAEKSLLLYDRSPFAYQVLASVAHQKKVIPNQISNWKRVLETSEGDTAVAELRRQAWMYLGDIYAMAADTAPDARKVALAKESMAMYRAFLADAPTDANAPAIRTNLSIVLKMAGDSASIPTLYADHLANPTKYSVTDMFAAGTIAGQANLSADAARLFENVVKAAPYHRDALYNLTASYLSEKKFAEMIPIAQRLVALDPSHKDNWSLLAYAYHSLQAALPATAAAQKKAMLDSILKYQEMGDSLKQDVSIATFSPRDSSASISGTIQNLDEKAPRTVRIKVEFLNKDGATVASKEETLNAIPVKGEAKFEIQNVPGVGIVAYKYTIPK